MTGDGCPRRIQSNIRFMLLSPQVRRVIRYGRKVASNLWILWKTQDSRLWNLWIQG